MVFFIDTANVDEIREINAWGVVGGVTTNPSLIAKEGRDYAEAIAEIASINDGPISAEVIAKDAEGMLREARAHAAIAKNVVIKIPMTDEGLKAVSVLNKEGIKTNVTLIFSVPQALLAARAGATYVSPFIGRLDDIGIDGSALVADIADIFMLHDIKTEIIAASIRGTEDVVEAAKSGAHIATVPYKVFKQMLHHPLTDAGIAKFDKDWAAAFDKKD